MRLWPRCWSYFALLFVRGWFLFSPHAQNLLYETSFCLSRRFGLFFKAISPDFSSLRFWPFPPARLRGARTIIWTRLGVVKDASRAPGQPNLNWLGNIKS